MKVDEPFTLPPSVAWLDRPPLDVAVGLQEHVLVVLVCRLGPALTRTALVELALEQASLPDRPVAFLVVHVPTCAAERDPVRLRRAMAALPSPLTVAVLDDRRWLAANGIDASPTLFVVDAQHRVRWRGRGVPRRLRLRAAVDELLAERRGGPDVRAPFAPLAPAAAAAFVPSAIAVAGERVYVACARRRQVLACDRHGRLLASYGSGAFGASDGPAAHASFGWPVALAVRGHEVVVADAGTHTLRAIDAETGEVSTWSGFGRLAADDVGGGYGRDQGLSVPNGLLERDGGCYLSQAGTRQIWQVDPATGAAMAWFGGGVDGSIHADQALEEPAGLAGTGETLWIADAGAGALVALDLAHVEPRRVADGFGRPVALGVHAGEVFVADAGEAAVFAVPEHGGHKRLVFGPAAGLVEPVGLWIEGAHLFVADAGAGAWFEADLGAPEPRLERRAPEQLPAPAGEPAPGTALRAAPVHLLEHSDVVLRVPVPVAEGACTVDVVDEATPVLASPRHCSVEVEGGHAGVLLPVAGPGQGSLRVVVRRGVRVDRFVLPVEVSPGGQATAVLAPST